ncbi:LANO_0H21748g1_1 [Lachancea nothofagi CBS 11611]|uniref:LANO_0H21748g1_1 n=1 Tax=Lachancea nothofagi CBS 11611 TaxID=1266666 RepID=A0A1G4KNE6_9SACH|nr:LANO_0H21748g1_1 [Lachancea nothofagi CBS 11611]
MATANPFRNVGRNGIYLVGGLIVSIFVSKKLINSNKKTQFNRMQEQATSKEDYYKNSAHVKPGFPLPAGELQDTRKSEFEGSGLSYLSRKGGDKLGFMDRKSGGA